MTRKTPQYSLNDKGEFVITDYNHSKPLANFFPGIAGPDGIPMWVFYVNRGQAVCSFGTNGKDGAILEFQPANKSWQTASQFGFRTFIKGSRAGKGFFYEPFHNGIANRDYDVENSMSMSSCDLSLSERNSTLGIEVRVRYFSIPGDSFAALARTVSIRNTGRKQLRFQVLDGLPQIVPYGENNYCLKEISRTIEAWMRVENLDQGVPLYRLSVDPGDRPQVVHIKAGNFLLGFVSDGKKSRIIKPIVDPDSIFGPINDFSAPRMFLASSWKGYPSGQQTQSKTPCGFLNLDMELAAGEEKSFNAVIGTVRSTGMLKDVTARVLAPGYLEKKAQENRLLIDGLTAPSATSSASSTFDLYCRQNFLDNILRGGTPRVFTDGDSRRVFYLYSRKHGDLERDYNQFQIQDTYFSQGNGAYRDINQNRRCDHWFEPRIGDFNISLFINLIQADGYNPLVLKGSKFVLTSTEEFADRAKAKVPVNRWQELVTLLGKPFTPGELVLFMEEKGIRPAGGITAFLSMLLPLCGEVNEADHGEGFWIDHWHYNLDLLESYFSLFPEEKDRLLFAPKRFSFYDNSATVAPRGAKYVLLDGKPRQLHSVVQDPDKRDLIASRRWQKNCARAANGKGEILLTSLFAKLLCVFANKFASLDPQGTGIEMEANKPNWYDALNGLPALFGSSSCETFELKRLIRFLLDGLQAQGVKEIDMPEEIADFFAVLSQLAGEWSYGGTDADLIFWQKSGAAREEYRQRVRLGFTGQERRVAVPDLRQGLEKALRKVEAGLNRAFDKSSGMYCGYFFYEVESYETLGSNRIRPLKFKQKRLPFFLEGQVHALRCNGAKGAKALHAAVRKGPLFDAKLKMYKCTASLAAMPEEIGRCRVFTPGWLENESIWLHMEYKYLLELLKQGLYAEFFEDMRNALIPFQNARQYGRSIVENSSFLVSSAFPYSSMHGNGFVARLSGSTAEFVQMWLLMNAGQRPFRLGEHGKLELRLEPALPAWMFRRKDKSYSFRFLGGCDVVYRNPKMKDTFAPGVKVSRIVLTDAQGAVTELDSGVIPSPLAEKVRSGGVAKIEAFIA